MTCAITTLCSGFVLGENVQAANNKEWKFENNKWSYVDSNNLRSKDWENIKGIGFTLIQREKWKSDGSI